MARMKQIAIDVDVNRAIESGRRTFSETENDILRRLLLQANVPQPENHGKSERPRTSVARARGAWIARIGGESYPGQNLKEAYKLLLLQLQKRHPDFLAKFSALKARSRRFVAKRPQDLYLSSPHLADEFAEPLVDGWYVDTNLSQEQVSKRVEEAARALGLKFPEQVSLSAD